MALTNTHRTREVKGATIRPTRVRTRIGNLNVLGSRHEVMHVIGWFCWLLVRKGE